MLYLSITLSIFLVQISIKNSLRVKPCPKHQKQWRLKPDMGAEFVEFLV